MNTKQLGSEAEKLVTHKLQIEGHKIIDINWSRPHAEIDIISKKSKTMYFTEVKFRSSLGAGDGFDYVTRKKIEHMKRGANSWVLENNWTGPYELLAASVTDGKIDLREI
jgi:putative endonuclease